ncbi:hypothetical protein F5Y12DRAFT_499098 [Xylaria sp. FL1777]|nr:hypothetical protein F5Y12DRAFT_499098 [Xylaria sp. FL1777]
MAVSPSSQCYQAVRRRFQPHHDSIWVPDSLLASAFERYVATFRTSARYGSSVPGPMEHRKRLAKRRMGELHFGESHPAAPIWQLSNLVDLTQWKWTPPTPPNARNRQSTNTVERRTLSDSVLSSMRSLLPSRTPATDDLQKLDQTLLPPDVTLSGVAESPPTIPWDVNSTPLDVIDAALDSLSQDKTNSVGISLRFSLLCDSWRQALREGLFHGEAIDKVLTGIGEGLSVKLINAYESKTIEGFRLLLLEATIEGISKGRIDETASFDYVAWISILRGVSTIQMNTMRVFTKAIACVPRPSLKVVSPGILEYLDKFVSALGRAKTRATLVRQTAKMAASLKSLGEPELRFVLDDATKMVTGYKSVDGVNYLDARFSWLLLLARLPGVDQDYLAQACIVLEAGLVTQPLTNSEICRLFLVWTNSQSPLYRYTDICKILKFDNTISYRLLGTALWKTCQFHRTRQLSKFLHAIGRETHVGLLAKGAIHRWRREPCQLAILALGMRKPLAAIDILCLYEESRRRKMSFWESKFGFRALEILTWSPQFEYAKLWRTLKIPGQEFGVQRRRGRLKGIDHYKKTKIAAVGIVTGLSPYITKRKALTVMMNCYLNLERHNTKLPRSFLRALVHNVTRQLAEGQPGISSRLRYVVYIIHRQMGREAAHRIAMAMQGRRESNFGVR